MTTETQLQPIAPVVEPIAPPIHGKVDAAGRPALVEVRDLKKYFPIRRGVLRRTVGHIKAVDGISFDIYKGETLGLVGESGCGKSTAGRSILQLEVPTAGSVQFADRELTDMGRNDIRKARRHMQMIFQDPYASLNPRMTVGNIISEPLTIHGIGDSAARKERVQELLRVVGLNPYFVNRYPHEFSGGQRQRIGVARALAVASTRGAPMPPTCVAKSTRRSAIWVRRPAPASWRRPIWWPATMRRSSCNAIFLIAPQPFRLGAKIQPPGFTGRRGGAYRRRIVTERLSQRQNVVRALLARGSSIAEPI